MGYTEFAPPAILRPYIDCYWLHTLESDETHFREQSCLPLGTIEMIIQVNQHPSHYLNKGGIWEKSRRTFFAGFYQFPVVWKAGPGSAMFGIRLKPESLITLFRLPASLLIDELIDAEVLLGHWIRSIGEEMCGITDPTALIAIAEKHLLIKLGNADTKASRFVSACGLIRTNPKNITIDQLSDKLSISRRQLERMFKEQLGTSPKTYQRIIRFTHAYQNIRESKNRIWTDITYDNGYADQSHFIRDFKEFAGSIPTEFTANAQSFMPKKLSID